MDRTGIEDVQVLKIQYFMSLTQYAKKNGVLLLPGFKHDGSSHPDSDIYDIVTLTGFRLNVTDVLCDAKNMHSSPLVASNEIKISHNYPAFLEKIETFALQPLFFNILRHL